MLLSRINNATRANLKRRTPVMGFAMRSISGAAQLQPALPKEDRKLKRDVVNPFTLGRSELTEKLAELNAAVKPLMNDPLEVLRFSMEKFDGRLAMTTSFGIQSALLLHLATQIKPNIPVVWVDTGYLPEETYRYADLLTNTLDLNLTVKTNGQWTPARMEAVYGKLWEKDHGLYGKMRKVEPLIAGLKDLDADPVNQPFAMLSGLRASQTKARANMEPIGFQHGRFKVLPILNMSDEDIAKYFDKYDLPRHPLEAKGYVTVGDWHSSRPVEEGEDARNTRFGGKFQECGLHVDETVTVPEVNPTLETTPGVLLGSYAATGVESLNKVKANPETDVAVIMVKKIHEDGKTCRKCQDVAEKMEADGVNPWIGDTVYADLRDATTDGVKLAKHFDIKQAPFFLVRTKKEINENVEWTPIRSYLQLRKMLQDSYTTKKKIDTHSV